MSKVLSTVISITQLLSKRNCTYNETDEIIRLLHSWIKQSREENEYKTISDYMRNNKTRNVDNEIITPMGDIYQ